MQDRRETYYFQEFACDASLEISIDANIPLRESSDIIAILGLFRSVEKVEFKKRDLDIIKLLQPYLSDRMTADICSGGCLGISRCSGELKCREHGAENNGENNWELNNIESLGLCAYNSSAELISNNASFSTFARTYSPSVADSQLTKEVTGCVRKLLNSDLCQMGRYLFI